MRRFRDRLIRFLPELQYIRRPEFPRGSFDYERYWAKRGRVSGMPNRGYILTEWIRPGSKVLEIGCGDGTFAEHLAEHRNCSVLAVDISQSAVDLARARGVDAKRRDVIEQPFEPDTFDYVVMSEVIEHLPSPETLLEAVGPVAPEVLVTVPNTAFLLYRVCLGLLGRFPTQWNMHPSEHLRFWSVSDFRLWAQAQGFVVVREAASNGMPILKRWHHNLFGHQICYALRRVDD